MLGAPMLIGVGPRGARGGGGLDFTFKTATGDADPGAGCVRLNNATHASATEAYIDDLDASGADAQALVATWTSTSTIKGELRIQHRDSAAIFRTYALTGQTDASGYTKLALTYVTGAGSLAADDPVVVSCSRVGSKGDAGAAGADGDGGRPVQRITVAGAAVATLQLTGVSTTKIGKLKLRGPNGGAGVCLYTLDLNGATGVTCQRRYEGTSGAGNDSSSDGWVGSSYQSRGVEIRAEWDPRIAPAAVNLPRIIFADCVSTEANTPASVVFAFHRVQITDTSTAASTLNINASIASGIGIGFEALLYEVGVAP